MSSERAIYTPTELNREVRLHLEAGFGRVRVEAEISNLSRPASGHLYFSLKDEEAQIRCAMFRSSAGKTGFRPENGMQVQVSGKLSLYEARGDYQLIVDSMTEAGEGRLQAAFEALKNKLQAEGLFDPQNKKPLPGYPSRIAVITSPSGAVIRDIIHVLQRRWPLAAVRLYPVPVQGETAAPLICAAIDAANRHGWADALILARGGGSLEDLQAFNQESVARAIAASGIPLVSAVGHETDFSISDFVADVRAPTPSAAAEVLTPDAGTLKKAFSGFSLALERRISQNLNNHAQRHDHLAQRLARMHPGIRMADQHKALRQLAARLAARAQRLPGDNRSLLDFATRRLSNATSRIIPQRRQALHELARTLNAVSPLPTLERGYAIVTDSTTGKAIASIHDVKPSQKIYAQLADGQISSTVTGTTPDKLPDPAPLP